MKQKLQNLDLKARVKLHTIALVIGMLITVIGCSTSSFGSLHPVAWIGLLIIAAGFLWRVAFIKCPHYGSGLYSVSSLPQHCSDCGEKLF